VVSGKSCFRAPLAIYHVQLVVKCDFGTELLRQAIYVAMSPLVGWLARRTLRRARLNLAEAMVVVLYVTAASNLLALLALPAYYGVTTRTGYFQVAFVSTLLTVAYQGWAYSQLLPGSPLSVVGRWWRGGLTAVGAYLLVVVGGVLLMVTLNWSTIKRGVQQEVLHQRALHQPAASTAR